MNLSECNFPHIKYNKDETFKQWGIKHGQEFKVAIKELFLIRKELMLSKNPALKEHLGELALKQFEITKDFCPNIAEEIEGIAEGSGLTLEDIVILNNYTDFRDIELPSEGCSTIHLQRETNSLAGQTWDMHGSAKNYLCMIEVPKTNKTQNTLILSLVGCVGLMGINGTGNLIGVNNINTKNAKIGLIWPALVRRVLEEESLKDMRELLKRSPVTSGHNYLISSIEGGEHWEITPEISQNVGALKTGDNAVVFHTNHCLGDDVKKLEDTSSMSSTTHARFELLTKKESDLTNLDSLYKLLTDHEGFPKSICSHYESGAQDPSFTCGGGIMDFNTGEGKFWRGCPEHDDNYIEYNFTLCDKTKELKINA